MASNSSRTIKLVATICFVLITVAALMAWNSPATGYESSIYNDTPLIFWIAIVISLLSGLGIVLHQLTRSESEQKLLLTSGIILIMLTYIAMLSLWIIKGYAFWGSGDPLSHLGTIQNLLADGHILEDNMYPIAHIYATEVSLITNLSPVFSIKYLPLLFGILHVPFIYLTARSVLPERGHVILATIAGTAFMGGWFLNFTPNHLATMFFPLVLFLLIKSFSSNTFQWKILFIIAIAVIVPFHPAPAIALLIILVGIWLSTIIQSFWVKNNAVAYGEHFRFSFAVFAIMFVWFFTWMSSFSTWDRVVRNTIRAITSTQESPFTGIWDMIGLGASYGYSVIEQFLKVYGGILLYMVLAFIGLFFLWKRASSKKKVGAIFHLYGSLFVLLLVIILLYINPSGSSLGFGAGRFMTYPLLLCTVFTGFTMYEVIMAAKGNEQFGHARTFARKVIPIIVAIILVGSVVNGGLTLYPSRYVLTANMHVTYSEMVGMDWFLHGKSGYVGIESMILAPRRFADFLLNPSERAQHEYEYLPMHIPGPDDKWRVAAHFGYDKHSSLGESYDKDIYLVLNEKSKVYQDIFPEVPEFQLLPVDFDRLEQDATVDKLYCNSGFDVWYVHAD